MTKWTCGIIPGHEHDTEEEARLCIVQRAPIMRGGIKAIAVETSQAARNNCIPCQLDAIRYLDEEGNYVHDASTTAMGVLMFYDCGYQGK